MSPDSMAAVVATTFLLLIPAMSDASPIPCPYKVCSCSSSTIDCRNKNLTDLPPLQTGSFTQTSLDISNNNISTIKDGDLPSGLTQLTSINNPLTHIQDNAFNVTSSSLNYLHIEGSQLDHLPWELMDLPELETFVWRNNPTTSWKAAVVSALGKTVTKLDLNSMDFYVLPEFLHFFSAVKSFSFEHNHLRSFDSNLLISDAGEPLFPNLESLDLSNNEIEDLTHFNMFRFSKKLKTINLSSNKIDNIDALINFDDLETLYLQANKICNHTDIHTALYPHRLTLTTLNLHSNCLTHIPDLSYMRNLHTLYLYSNKISNSPDDVLPTSLTYLNLGNNALTSVPPVSTLTHLTDLGVYGNKITSIDDVVFPSSLSTLHVYSNNIKTVTTIKFADPSSNNLRDLYLSNNPLSSISADAFKELKHLTHLYLHSTRLTRLPLTLAHLTNLDTLAIYNNPDLTCTCQEASLVTWFDTRPDLYLYGDCDGTTVKYFLDHLAENCQAS